MFWLKGCTRCGGDLASGSDHYGPYISCLQCGSLVEMNVEPVLAPPINEDSIAQTVQAISNTEALVIDSYRSPAENELAVVPA